MSINSINNIKLIPPPKFQVTSNNQIGSIVPDVEEFKKDITQTTSTPKKPFNKKIVAGILATSAIIAAAIALYKNKAPYSSKEINNIAQQGKKIQQEASGVIEEFEKVQQEAIEKYKEVVGIIDSARKKGFAQTEEQGIVRKFIFDETENLMEEFDEAGEKFRIVYWKDALTESADQTITKILGIDELIKGTNSSNQYIFDEATQTISSVAKGLSGYKIEKCFYFLDNGGWACEMGIFQKDDIIKCDKYYEFCKTYSTNEDRLVAYYSGVEGTDASDQVSIQEMFNYDPYMMHYTSKKHPNMFLNIDQQAARCSNSYDPNLHYYWAADKNGKYKRITNKKFYKTFIY